MSDITVALCFTDHDINLTILKDGRLLNILQEDRFSKIKHSGGGYLSLLEPLLNFPEIKDFVSFNAPSHTQRYIANFLKKNKIKVKNFYDSDQIRHHEFHAYSAFYKSRFEEAGCLSIDGFGGVEELEDKTKLYRTCAIFKADMSGNFEEKYNRWLYYPQTNSSSFIKPSKLDDIDSSLDIGMVWDALTRYLGFSILETGKAMGLSSYGKSNPLIPEILHGDTLYTNSNLFIGNREINCKKYPIFQNPTSEIKEDLAYEVQKSYNKVLLERVKQTMDLCSTYNVALSGGCSLNVIGNYYVKKSIPKLNLFVDPIGGDSGISYGLAKHFSNGKSKTQLEDVYRNNYNGLLYSNDSILKTIKSDNRFKIKTVSYSDVAKLISKKNIVAIFQGPSESGPRALGNRSILYDPRDPNGKDHVNQVKQREKFRPFAGTILLEKANEWFDMAGLYESPYMSYAVDVLQDKQSQIPSITHVDGTCRVQTVTKFQNYHYCKLIKEFENITGVPILFNTSFNLAGDPLVETIEDALETLLKSELKYLYLPELEMLLEKK